VFISYRREDASGFAGRLYESLSRHFGTRRIFRDVETIRPGADFGEVIHESLRSCGAFVVMIGREWLVDSRGRRRLDDPEDWVRQEVAIALERDDVAVFPVLVEGVAMPSADALPGPLAALARQNATELSDSRWEYDLARLVTELDTVVGAPDPSGPLRRVVLPRSPSGALVRVAALAAVVAIAVAGIVAVRRTPGPVPMAGHFNIAVADFGSTDSRDHQTSSKKAHELAQSVYDRLDDELASIPQSGFELGLRGPARTGPVEGSTPDRRAVSAGNLARRINADVVVYGTLDLNVPSRFTTEFFIGDHRLAEAEELEGQHELGSAIRAIGDVTRNPVADKGLRDSVLERTRALAEFLVGLSYYAVDQAQPALDHFEAARSSPGWDDRAGKEVLYLFLGNTAGKLRDFGAADGYYDGALSLNPEYGRARLGKAEVTFQRARANCESGSADPTGLSRSLDMFQSALGSRVQPAASEIATKVAYGSGRVLLCLSQALVADRWADAERQFQSVIRAFRAGNERVREMAAESYANLGLVYLPAAADPQAAPRYRKAAESYQAAVTVTHRDDRKAFFLNMRGFTFSRLGDVAGADDAYRQAVDLEPDPVKRAEYEQARQQAIQRH